MSCPLDLSKSPEEFHYETDETYQSLFQNLFHFHENLEEIGDVYDAVQVKVGMNYILSKTSEVDEWWKQLFTKAAGMFLSEDAELGLCVCLNFSYLDIFYKVFYCWEKDPQHEKFEVWKQDFIRMLE